MYSAAHQQTQQQEHRHVPHTGTQHTETHNNNTKTTTNTQQHKDNNKQYNNNNTQHNILINT